MTYVDSSALVPLYVPERFSATARAVVRHARQVPFTVLHQLELANAFGLLAGRGLITGAEREAVLGLIEEDIEGMRLVPTALDYERMFEGASDLSRRYAAKFLARSLDLLHVAAAHLVRCKSFVSADDRQLAVARASGLAVVDIKRAFRRRGR